MRKLGFDLILLGAPAAGKDTQAKLLMRKFKLHAVESGKHWRRAAKQNNAEGELLRRTFSRGNPAPVMLMKRFILNKMKSVPNGTDLLFIGNPRLKPEAQLLVKLLKDKKRDFYVIGIRLPAKEITKRSLKRQRDDQDWKYIGNRIKMYRLQVSKTLEYFKGMNKLQTVDGNRPVPAVASEISRIIDGYQRRKANSSS